MSKKDIQKNFKLSEDFNSYVVRNPKVVKNIPENACIIMTPKNDSKLSEKNLKLAEKIMKKEHKPCFRAMKENQKWKIKPIPA